MTSGTEAVTGPVVLVVEQASTFQMRLAAGLDSVLRPLGVPLLVHIWGEDTAHPPAAIRTVLDNLRPRAVVVNPLVRGEAQQHLARMLADRPWLPRLYLCGADVGDGAAGSVRADNAHGMRVLAGHVIDDCAGRRVLVVRGNPTNADSLEREHAVRAELARLGRPVDADHVVDGGFEREPARVAVEAALRGDPDIDAVIAFNDRSALGAVDAVLTTGRRVPQDVVVTGFDDEDFAALCTPSLTTASQNLYEMGRTGGELLRRMLAGEEPRQLRVPVQLMPRASTLRAPASHPVAVDQSGRGDELWGQLAALDVGLAMSRDFMDCTTIEEIADRLRVNLAVLGMSRAYLVLRSDDEGAGASGVLAMAHRDGARDDAVQGAPVAATALLPDELADQLHRGTMVLQPLDLGRTQIGYLLLDQPLDRVPHTAEILRMGLSRTIDTIRHTARLAERTCQLEWEVASRHAAQQALVDQATQDALTGLANRDAFLTLVDATLRDRDGAGTALLMVDLDRFKDVNDSLGHSVGDALLREVAARLGALVGDRGAVCRLAADEFAVLGHGRGDPQAATTLAREVLGELRRQFRLDSVTLEVEATVGIACAPLHAEDAGTLLRMADLAMYAARSDRVGVALYDPAEHLKAPRRLALFGELRRALARREFVVHYQPVVEVASGRVSGVEALVRWNHPTLGLLPPSEFIELAEQTGLIHDLTTYVLDQALTDCRIWADGELWLTTAVNVSTRRLMDTELPVEVAALLARHGVPPQLLDLEITETAAMADPRRSLEVLRRLRDLGVHLSVDDFGTGHASLAYLSRLPVNWLKIDRSFVLAMESDPANMTIVRSTLDLARSLGLGVIAEGVETASAFEVLESFGCARAQGFWLARPAPAAEIPALVDDVQQRLASLRLTASVPPPRRGA